MNRTRLTNHKAIVMRSLAVAGLLSGGMLLSGCNDAQSGTLLGAGAGAGLGAIIGHQSGHAGNGALIGAGAGALAGYIIGNESDKDKDRRYRDNGYEY